MSLFLEFRFQKDTFLVRENSWIRYIIFDKLRKIIRKIGQKHLLEIFFMSVIALRNESETYKKATRLERSIRLWVLLELCIDLK